MVIDSDGSAFITKAEFDSLQNNFQSQIDGYNSSIDAKIDSAIAAYLAGVSLSKTITIDNLLKSYQVTGCTGGIAWNKSDTYITNSNDKQTIAWNLTIFGASSNGVRGNKYASYQNYKSSRWEKRLLTTGSIVEGFYKWEPRLTGSAIGVNFKHSTSTGIPIHDGSNGWTFYDNLNLTKDNRKNTQTVAGGFHQKTYYESTMYSVTYAEYTEAITDQYVITPYSTADELIVDSEETFTLSDTATQINVETSADFIKGGVKTCAGVATASQPYKGASSTGFRMAAQVGLKAVQRNTLESRDLTNQCAGNGAMSSGLVLCVPQNKGKLYGQIKGSGTGKVLLWQGDETSTYASSTKKTDFTIDTTFKDFKFEDIEAKKYVRIIFEPDTDTQSLDFKDIYLDISD